MPTQFAALDNAFPAFAGGESTEQKVDALYDYVFLLLENLRYILRNLSPENFNEAEVEDWIGRNVRAQTVVSEAVVTNELYSRYGAIADLVVDELRTDYQKAARYLAGNTAALDFLHIHDEEIDFISGTTYALNGEIKKVGHNVFLCAPSNVNVSYTEEDKKVSAEMPWLKK